MNLGIKISKKGYNVGESTGERGVVKDTDPKILGEMVSSLSLAFILGAEKQVQRYVEAYATAEKNPQASTFYCLHEALSLLEDLDTLSWYTQVCGETNDMNPKIRLMRNHARHDMRDNVDHESHKGRKDRAKKLGISDQLMVHIGFSEDAIKMGETILTLDEVNSYIKWSTNILTDRLANGVKEGRIKGVELA